MMLRRSTVRARARGVLFAVLAAVALQGAAPVAHAQTPDEINQARAAAKEGLGAYKSGDFKKALILFDQARKLYPSAQILRMAGYSYLALEEWEKAATLMDAATASTVGPLDAEDRKDVTDQLAKALPHIGSLSVTSDVEGAELIIGKRAAVKLPLEQPLRLAIGTYKITVHAPEHTDATQEVTIAGEGKLTEVKLAPVPIPKVVEPPPPPPKPLPPPPPPPPPKGWIPMQFQIGLIAAGAGVAVGAAAVTTGIGALYLTDQVNADIKRHNDGYGQSCEKVAAQYHRDCAFDVSVINHDSDRANTLANASLATAIAGGVLLTGGVALVLFAPQGPLGAKAKPVPKDETTARAKAPSSLSAACAPLPTGGISCAGTF